MIDNHSRYPVVETQIYFSKVCNTSDIYILFSLFAISEELNTDNDPPFQNKAMSSVYSPNIMDSSKGNAIMAEGYWRSWTVHANTK